MCWNRFMIPVVIRPLRQYRPASKEAQKARQRSGKAVDLRGASPKNGRCWYLDGFMWFIYVYMAMEVSWFIIVLIWNIWTFLVQIHPQIELVVFFEWMGGLQRLGLWEMCTSSVGRWPKTVTIHWTVWGMPFGYCICLAILDALLHTNKHLQSPMYDTTMDAHTHTNTHATIWERLWEPWMIEPALRQWGENMRKPNQSNTWSKGVVIPKIWRWTHFKHTNLFCYIACMLAARALVCST